jgi:regulator of replication initiation timing
MDRAHPDSGAPMRQARSSEEKFWSKSYLVQASLRDIAAHFGSEVRELIADVLVKHHTGILEVLRELHEEKVRIRLERDALRVVLKNLLDGLSADDEEGLIEHVPQIIEARATLADMED